VHDIKAIRDNPAAFDKGLERRGILGEGDGKFSAKQILALDEARRAHVTKLQDAQARRNAASKEIGAAKKAKDEAKANALMAEVAALKETLASGEEKERDLTRALEDVLAWIPNLPLEEVPFGTDETGNAEVRRVGDPKAVPAAKLNAPKQHFELGEALGMMDFETAGKVSGARFVYLKGELARLERALAQFMLDLHTEEFGYTEVNPPLMVRDAAAYGTANLPKFADDLFQTRNGIISFETLLAQVEARAHLIRATHGGPSEAEVAKATQHLWDMFGPTPADQPRTSDDPARLWLIPTAEVSLTNLVREQILDEDALPKRFTAWTPCFRGEAGSAGRDVRGMIRQHQFSKVELVSVTTPETALAEHERMTKCAETILERLGLPFRTMLLCTGDMGFASQKTYDIEVWLPGQNAYREISSCSVCGDFQARRMSARYRPKGSKDVRHVATLNGSGLAVGRTLIAVMENYQQADGSIAIPEALRPYMRGRDRIAAR
jgi:seryl-tRNA synthetase